MHLNECTKIVTENSFMIDDEPYSSALVRKRVFEKLRSGELN